MLIFEKLFSRVENVNSWELDQVSTGILALRIRIPRKTYGDVAWSWLVHTGMVMSSRIFIPSTHSESESPSQVPGQTCGLRELVKLTTRSNIDSCFLSLRLTS